MDASDGQPNARTTEVLIYDESPAQLAALCELIDQLPGVRVVSTVLDRHSLLVSVLATDPDIVLFGCNSYRSQEIEAAREVVLRHPTSAVILLCDRDDVATIAAYLAVGAHGFLGRDSTLTQLSAALATLTHSRRRLGMQRQRTAPQLSPREREVLGAISQGLSNQQIASQLSIAPNTVGVFVSRVFRKLEVNGRAHAVAVGIRQRLIS